MGRVNSVFGLCAVVRGGETSPSTGARRRHRNYARRSPWPALFAVFPSPFGLIGSLFAIVPRAAGGG
jgi:hypothetical protein